MQYKTTPAGKAHWPFLKRPFTNFDPEGVYKITLELDKAEESTQEFISKVDSASKGMKQRPYKVDEESGNYLVNFATKYKPDVFDSSNNNISDDIHIGDDVEVGSGSTVRVAFSPKAYEGFGGGIKLYLKAVQVLELVKRVGGDAEDYGFDTQEGGYTLPDDGFTALLEDDSDKKIASSDDLDW